MNLLRFKTLPSFKNVLSGRQMFLVEADVKFSQTLSTQNKIYELRTYNVKPKYLKDYTELTKKYIHLRTAHSKLIGYWYAELGNLNQSIHLWEYDNYAHRAQVRAGLVNDNKWVNSYLSKMLGMIESQTHELLTLLPGVSLHAPTDHHVSELQVFTIQRSNPVWLANLAPGLKYFESVYEGHGSHMLGAFCTDYGTENKVIMIWNHRSFDIARLAKHQLYEKIGSADLKVQLLFKQIESIQSTGMIPKK